MKSLPAAVERRLHWATGLGVFLVYALFPSFLHNFDGVACAIAVELGDWRHLVHGNHLIYGVVGWLFHRGLALIGLKMSALFALKVLDMLLGAAGAALFHKTLRKAKFKEPIPLSCALGLAFSYGYWLWSLEAQVYLLGAFFLVGGLYEALRDHPSPYRLALWHGLAMLTHGGNALFVPVALYALWRSNQDPEKLRRAVARYLVLAAGLVLVVYATTVAAWVRPGNWDELKIWLLGSAALLPGRGYNFITGGQWHNAVHWLRSSGEVVSSLWVLALPVWAAALWMLRHREGGERRYALSAWLWLPAYALLFTQWQPGVLVYRISDLIPLWLLAAAAAARLEGQWRRLLPAFVLTLIAANFWTGVRRFASPESNPKALEAAWLRSATPENAWVAAIGVDEVYYPYFGHRRPLNLRYYAGRGPALTARIRTLLESAPVYITSDRLKAAPDFRRSFALRAAGRRGGVTLYEVISAPQVEKGNPNGRMKKKLSTAPMAKNGPNGMGSER